MTMARSEGLAGLESSPKDTPSAGRLKTNRADSTLVLNVLDVVALGQHRGRRYVLGEGRKHQRFGLATPNALS